MEDIKVYKNVRNHDMGKTIFNWENEQSLRIILAFVPFHDLEI